MQLNSIIINNFKSIKQPIELDLSQSMVTMVGKNGSGKTNILDSLFSIFNYNTYYENSKCDFRLFVKLSANKIKEYTEKFGIKIDNPMIEAYYSQEYGKLNTSINRIKSTFFIDLLLKTEESIYSISSELKKELLNFGRTIDQLADDSPGKSSMSIDVDYSNKDIYLSTNYGWWFNHLKIQIDTQINEIKKILKERKKGEELIVDYHHFIPINTIEHSFELKYNRPKLTKFESKHISIDEEAIKQEIIKINKKTKDQQNKIGDLNIKLRQKLNELHCIIEKDYGKQVEFDDNYHHVLNEIINVCNPKIYYLRNENNQLFFNKGTNFNYYKTLDEKIILDTFIKYKYGFNAKNDIAKKIDEGKLSVSEKKDIALDLERVINDNIPDFEKDMIKEIKVTDNLELFIVEKSGDEISFSNTNAGRRWFYTYFLVKGCLQQGDILLMDEPASNLHPQAQIHIRKELEEISIKNKVIISTHSPYMISPNSSVYYVDITPDGTKIINTNNIDIHNMYKNLGVFDKETIIGDILINNKLLDFKSIGKRLKEILKEKGIKQQKVADDYQTDLRNMTRKLSGEHLTFNDIEWFCRTYKIDPIRVTLEKYTK